MVLFPRIYILSCLNSKPSSLIWSSFRQRNDRPVKEKEKKTIIEWSHISSTLACSYSGLCSTVNWLSFERERHEGKTTTLFQRQNAIRHGNVDNACNREAAGRTVKCHMTDNYISPLHLLQGKRVDPRRRTVQFKRLYFPSVDYINYVSSCRKQQCKDLM